MHVSMYAHTVQVECVYYTSNVLVGLESPPSVYTDGIQRFIMQTAEPEQER